MTTEVTRLELAWATRGCLCATGFDYEFLCSFYDGFVRPLAPGSVLRDFFALLVLLKNNLSWDALEGVQVAWSPRRIVSERQLRRDVGTILNPVTIPRLVARCVNPLVRFSHLDFRFPSCTCIVDATPVPVRGDSRLLNGKYHQKVLKFEVYVTLQGVPFFWRGPYLPTHHDAAIFAGQKPPLNAEGETQIGGDEKKVFVHYAHEYILADQGYVGCSHCVTAPKRNETGASDIVEGTLKTKGDFLKDRIVIVRTRIEHFFLLY